MVVVDNDETLGVDDLPPELYEAPTAPAATANADLHSLVGRPMGDVERLFIEATLQFTEQNREKAAQLLGIGARTLYRKIKEYGLQHD
jgi:two-component system response regulator HydG